MAKHRPVGYVDGGVGIQMIMSSRPCTTASAFSIVSPDRDYVARELHTSADDVRAVNLATCRLTAVLHWPTIPFGPHITVDKEHPHGP